MYIDATHECYAWWQYLWLVVLLAYVVPVIFVLGHAPFKIMSNSLSSTQFVFASAFPLPYTVKVCFFGRSGKDSRLGISETSNLEYHALGDRRWAAALSLPSADMDIQYSAPMDTFGSAYFVEVNRQSPATSSPGGMLTLPARTSSVPLRPRGVFTGARAGVLDVLGRPYKQTLVWWQAIMILVRLLLIFLAQAFWDRRLGPFDADYVYHV